MASGKLAIHRWKRPGDEVSRRGEAGGTELRARRIVAVEQVVHLSDHVQPGPAFVAAGEGDDGVAVRAPFDTTDNRATLLSVNARRRLSGSLSLSANYGFGMGMVLIIALPLST